MVLLFFSHAGGSAKSYVSFKRFLPKELTVVPMELSGRFSRMTEPLIDNVPDCVSELISQHKDILSGDYALFGHSMGTVLVTEFVRQAKEMGLPQPCHVFLSGKNPPDEEMHCFETILTASDEEIVEYFTKNSLSMASPVPQDNALVKILNKILCTDVRMAERYKATPQDVTFDCDVTVFFGESDPLLRDLDMSTWQRFTSGKCEVYSFPGDHFYYQQNKEAVCGIIKQKLHI